MVLVTYNGETELNLSRFFQVTYLPTRRSKIVC